ncbi:MAG: HINT domain-containing protein [Leptospirales bacterium]|nr:HINT domain-containing protein [Leptospirales bacterium]
MGLSWNADNSFGLSLNNSVGSNSLLSSGLSGVGTDFSHTFNWNADGGFEGVSNNITTSTTWQTWAQVHQNLKRLHKEGRISDEEYQTRSASASNLNTKVNWLLSHRATLESLRGEMTDEELADLLKDPEKLSAAMHDVGLQLQEEKIAAFAAENGRAPTDEELMALAPELGQTRDSIWDKITGGVSDFADWAFFNKYSDDDGYIDPETGEWRQNTCFVAGTLVRVHHSTPGARFQGGHYYKVVEDIVPGDLVLAKDEDSGELLYSRVQQTFIRSADRIYQIRYEDGTLIETTWSHPFYVRGKGWIEARYLRAGDVGETAAGQGLMISSVEIDPRYETVYNFEVEKHHNYFVSEAGVLVHNEDDYGKSIVAQYARIVLCAIVLNLACGAVSSTTGLLGHLTGVDPVREKLDELEQQLLHYEDLSAVEQGRLHYSLAEMGLEIVAGGPEGVEGALSKLRYLRTLLTGGRVATLRPLPNLAGGRRFLQFTYNNIRENLARLTGRNPANSHAHHIFPEKFADKFERIFQESGLSIHDPRFATWWEKTDHLRHAVEYNRRWERFFREGGNSADDVLRFGDTLAKEFGFATHY